MSRSLVLFASLLVVAGCDRVGDPDVGPPPPNNLRYRLDVSGDPEAPAGVLLEWDAVITGDLEVYNVYSRVDDQLPFDLRASTTSTSFHDAGIPDLFYAVTAVTTDGDESELSEDVFIDERLRLPAPNFLSSTSLDGAIHLEWADNPFLSDPDGFEQYRVYSSGLDIDAALCDDDWALEGTTVAPTFLAGALPNGMPRCFAIAAETIEGWESLWSEIRGDTPRPDARNVLIFPFGEDANRSGFRFFQDLNSDGVAGPLELGIIRPGSATDIDFWVSRDPVDSSLSLVPGRAGTGVELFDPLAPVEDLTSIDFAPNLTFRTTPIVALPGYGYVFETIGLGGLPQYGALRPTHVGRDYMIFDWAFQTDPGNPELQIRGGLPTALPGGVLIKR